MKSVQLSVVALLIVCLSCAEALKCNHCVLGTARVPCTNTVKECGRSEDVCINVIMAYPTYSYFRRCSRRTDAQIMASSQHLQVTICETDRCN